MALCVKRKCWEYSTKAGLEQTAVFMLLITVTKIIDGVTDWDDNENCVMPISNDANWYNSRELDTGLRSVQKTRSMPFIETRFFIFTYLTLIYIQIVIITDTFHYNSEIGLTLRQDHRVSFILRSTF